MTLKKLALSVGIADLLLSVFGLIAFPANGLMCGISLIGLAIGVFLVYAGATID